MAIECAYSFTDLYKAAHKQDPQNAELQELYSLPQVQRNEIVRKWAAAAKWETKQRVGSDGQVYIAFAPKF